MSASMAQSASSVDDDLLYEVREGIGQITFNRPRARNALTFAMYERMAQIARGVKDDPSIRVLIITGAGEKAFASGTDISQFRAFETPRDAIDYEDRIESVLGDLETCPVPVVAAIAGACTGGGAAIAGCCDIRIGTADSRFGFPIARTLGNCLSMSNIGRLVALIGPARVKDLIMTARLVGAEEAKAIGLLNEVVPDAEALRARAWDLARAMSGHAPLTMRAAKEAVRRLTPRIPAEEGQDLILSCYMSQDFREGMDAFLAKRKPQWKGV
ncbi:enoyl-CoA hydratase/isomerase family protein [Enterovirga sp.]|uniref:enoyl-CoA hydratase/isomerase family protein n=1 Tax=Enterovirga sp. TaxID=2026350 RepID=UPI002B7CC04D|nr:enoyl-CoA hydratase/isomerase family protein [Enterovirga sp.]HMO29420.1 enoyl-CoA hydratase/isomerase family protein [Enterovirga sp.]